MVQWSKEAAGTGGKAMIVEQLRAVIAQAEVLSAEEQEALAEVWQEALEEREWDALLRKPGSARFLKELIEEGRREHAAGKTEEITGDSFE
jgi:hypothetical protein